jgi:hypothetical protein
MSELHVADSGIVSNGVVFKIPDIRLLKLISKFCDKSSTRYALSGLHVRSTGSESVIVSATNGMSLISMLFVQATTFEFEPFVIPSELIERSAKGATKSNHARLLSYDEKIITISARGESQSANPVQGRFPCIADVYPLGNDIPDEVNRYGRFHPEQLAKFYAIGDLIDEKVEITQSKPNSVAFVSFTCRDDLAGVIMPLVGNDTIVRKPPSWVYSG